LIVKDSKDNTTSLEKEIEYSQNYNSEYFSISYPANFQIEEIAPAATLLANIRLVTSTEKEISIMVFPREGNTVDSLSTPYQNDNYKGKIIQQNDMYGFFFEGRIEEFKLNERVALLQKGYTIIRMKLTYVGEKDLDLEAQFDAILTTLK